VGKDSFSSKKETLTETQKPIDTAAEVAKTLHMSKSTYEKGKKIRDEGTEEEQEAVRSGKESIAGTSKKIEARKAKKLPKLPAPSITPERVKEIKKIIDSLAGVRVKIYSIKPEEVEAIGIEE
jgi:leucyl aminopeptidase